MNSPLQTMRMTFGPLLASPVILGIALFFALPEAQRTGSPETLHLGIVVIAGMLVTALVQGIGYRTQAIDPSTPTDEAVERGINAFRTGTTLRFALSEVPMFVGIAFAFVGDAGGLTLFLLGGVLSLALMGLHVFPNDYSIRHTQAALEADGARVPLAEALNDPGNSVG